MRNFSLKNQLIQLINNSNESSLRSIYDFAQFIQSRELEKPENSVLSNEQQKELDTIKEQHLSGKTPSLSLEELRQNFTKKYGI